MSFWVCRSSKDIRVYSQWAFAISVRFSDSSFHSQWAFALAISPVKVHVKSQTQKLQMGATPKSDLVFAFMLMLTLTVNGPIHLHCIQNKSPTKCKRNRSLWMDPYLKFFHAFELEMCKLFEICAFQLKCKLKCIHFTWFASTSGEIVKLKDP